MTPRVTARQKVTLLALFAAGFAGLFGAHEVAELTPPLGAPRIIAPLLLVALGVACFIGAGLMARRLMR